RCIEDRLARLPEGTFLKVVEQQPRLRRVAQWALALSVAACLGLCVRTACADESSSLIEGCAVFDPASGKMLPERTIVIRGDRIAAVTGPDAPVDIPTGAVRIDGRGRFALPGLIDAHVHLMHV